MSLKQRLAVCILVFVLNYLDEIETNYKTHRRKIKTEKNAKVFASVWEVRFIQFLAALAFVHWMIEL